MRDQAKSYIYYTPTEMQLTNKGAVSHISTIHNSDTKIPCQQGHQETGNAL